MTKNVGVLNRVLRAVGGAAMLSGIVLAPVPLVVRVIGFGGLGAYLLFSSVAGTCFGYRLMGRSTCPVQLGQ